MGQINCFYSNWRDPHHSSINLRFYNGGGENKFKPDWFLCSSISLSLLYNPVSVLFLDHQTQEPRWPVNEIIISKTVLFVSFLLLSPPYACFLFCVALKVLWRKALKIWRQNAALWSDELVRVWTLYLPVVSIRARWRETFRIHHTASGNFA